MIINPYSFGGGGGASLLLDTYTGAEVGYSFRQLRGAATNCLRVRRSSDSTEQDIGFVSGVIDVAAMETFCGAGSGFVAKWYDQSTNGNDAVQAVASRQPTIVSAGTTNVSVNGFSAMSFGASQWLYLTGIATTQLCYHSFLFDRTASTISSGLCTTGTNTPSGFMWYLNNVTYTSLGALTLTDSGKTATGDILVTTLRDSADDTKMWHNGSAQTTKNYANVAKTFTTISGYYQHSGMMQEVIYWNTDQETNRSGIETDTNSYYSIW